MNEMIEKVANAIAVADLNASAKSLPDVPMEMMAEYVRLAVEDGHYQAMARAAIEAMREPTEAMLTAGWAATPPFGDHNPDGAWRAMVDAALSEEKAE